MDVRADAGLDIRLTGTFATPFVRNSNLLEKTPGMSHRRGARGRGDARADASKFARFMMRSARAPTATRGGACSPQAMKFVGLGEDLGACWRLDSPGLNRFWWKVGWSRDNFKPADSPRFQTGALTLRAFHCERQDFAYPRPVW